MGGIRVEAWRKFSAITTGSHLGWSMSSNMEKELPHDTQMSGVDAKGPQGETNNYRGRVNKSPIQKLFVCSSIVYPSIHLSVYSSTGANLDFLLNTKPYFMNINGTGMASTATPPSIDIAGPTPSLWNIGLAASGNPAARILRRKVFADTALAAYS